jgi:hypothetical protein
MLQVAAALCPLQQYSRARLPGTTTFKPMDPCNMTAVQPAHGPTIDTTYGLTNAIISKYDTAADSTVRAGFKSRHGIMSFFSAGASESASDNGTSNAQQYDSMLSAKCCTGLILRLALFPDEDICESNSNT